MLSKFRINSLRVILAFAVIGFIICEDCSVEQCSSEEATDENLKRLGLASNNLAINIYHMLSSMTDDNIFFSPFTISTVLTMLYRGTKGETAQELRKFLGFDKSKLEDSAIFASFHQYITDVLEQMDPHLCSIKFASAVIADSSSLLKPDYIKDVTEIFEAYVENSNMTLYSGTVTRKLNLWVKKKSKGFINSLVDHIDPATVLMLVSAAYFKGSWRVKFDPMDTKYHVFFNNGNNLDKRDALMMYASGSYRYYEEEDQYSAVELSYEDKNISMMIFLPKELNGLPELEKTMSTAKISLVRRYMYRSKVHLTLPKFKLAFDRDISEELQELGVKKVFETEADLSGMIADSTILALEVRHKATIEVNEKGSIAAAISSLFMTKMIPDSDTIPEFRADHPFFFVIIDTRSSLILFMGRINNL